MKWTHVQPHLQCVVDANAGDCCKGPRSTLHVSGLQMIPGVSCTPRATSMYMQFHVVRHIRRVVLITVKSLQLSMCLSMEAPHDIL